MSPLGEPAAVEIGESALWDLGPSISRVHEIDSALRRRLAESLAYLGEFASLDAKRQAVLQARLMSGPVSPWVFCLYTKLVAELSNNSSAEESFEDILLAASFSGAQGVVALRESAISGSWWDQLQLLLDTDRNSPFRPEPPSGKDFGSCRQEIDAGLAVMQRIDSVWFDEVRSLLRMIVLGSPASPDLADFFNGASTFFLWGLALLNANLRRGPIPILDLLVHESSHVLLFGLSADGGLTRNSGKERYGSPVRADKRPIDGIFHACFVTTRVHLAMRCLLDSGSLGQDDSRLAIKYRDSNEKAGREALAVLERHAKPTKVGKAILSRLHRYWANQPD
jgi:hypothetical protein